MCVGGPSPSDVPRTPERQSVRQPETSARDISRDDERRRRGMMATILTSARGALTPVSTTADPKVKLG